LSLTPKLLVVESGGMKRTREWKGKDLNREKERMKEI
jgi:hypothetical protein